MEKNVISLEADLSTSVHIDDKNKNILITVEGPKQGLNDTSLKAEAKCPINFTQSVEDYTLCLGNISKDFTIHNMKKKQKRIKRQYKICFR